MSTVKSGTITVTSAGTAVAGPSESSKSRLRFAVKAASDNSGAVYMGNDGADDVTSSNGFPLAVGEGVVVEANSLSEFYFDADNSGDKLLWLLLG